MKITKSQITAYGIMGIIQILFLVIGIVKHDWFYLLACYVLNPNLQRVINYEGEEE